MTKDQKRFFHIATILLAIVLVVSQIIFSTIFETKDFPLRIISICIVWLATCASHYWVMKTVTEKPKAFSRVFMLQTTIKLMLYMACIVAYLLLYREHGVPFTVHFVSVYLVFAVFEVILIMKFVKNNTGPTSGNIKKSN
jgi:Fe2+ transport system protein B